MNSSRREKFFWGIVLFLVCLIPLFLLQVDIRLGSPIHLFTDDSILVWNIFKGIIHGDVRPYQEILLPQMAAPYSPLNFSEGFPITEQLQFFVLKLMSFFIQDPVILGDSFFVLGYVLAALSFYLSAVLIRIRPAIAFGLSIAFAYINFHWLRYDHIFLSHYWVLAPAAAVVFRSFDWKFEKKSEVVMVAVTALLTSLWHSYYGFFFVGVFCLVSTVRLIRDRKGPAPFKIFVPMGVALGMMILAFGASTAHYFVARNQPKELPAKFSRYPGEALFYRLRVGAALLPTPNHRIPILAELRQAYQSRVQIREGLNESIGSLGLFGFLLGFFQWIQVLRKKRDPSSISRLGGCQVAVFAFCGPLGLALLISLFVSPVFRSVNRISPMLAAFALFSLGMFLSERFQWSGRLKQLKYGLVGVFLAVFALFDQIPADPRAVTWSHQGDYRAEIQSVRDFMAAIDPMIGNGMVLQLPAMGFPEAPYVHAMANYVQSLAPLFSNEGRFSYGVWKGTLAFATVESLSLNFFDIPRLKTAGFIGVWIDRMGYPDNGAWVVQQLEMKLARKPLQSADGRRVFFSLR